MNKDNQEYDLNDDMPDTPDQAGGNEEGGDDPAMEEGSVFTDILEIGIRIDEPLSVHAEQDTDAATLPDTGMIPGSPVEDEAAPEETAIETGGLFPVAPEESLLGTPLPASADETAADALPDGITALHSRMEELFQAFDTKLKYDAHKNKIIDDLHQNLQQHRDGLLKKYLHRIVMDVIKIVDDMRKLAAHYHQLPHSEETSAKLLKYIENIASDLEDMFSWEGVTPFTCDGNTVDPARQRVLSKVETDDPEKDKTIAERLRPGYEWDGKVIRPEMVSVYVYQTNSPSGN